MSNNPSAFPREQYGPMSDQPGMTLRDYFAGQALAGGLIAHYGVPLQAEGIAEGAYDIADAMLAERNENRKNGENNDRKRTATLIR